MGCGGHLHQAETKIWEFLVSKGDAEHRSVAFHQRDEMADISLGYETEWHSMSVQLVSENLNFLSSFIDEHAEPQSSCSVGGTQQR